MSATLHQPKRGITPIWQWRRLTTLPLVVVPDNACTPVVNDVCAELSKVGEWPEVGLMVSDVGDRLGQLDESPDEQASKALVVACQFGLGYVDDEDPFSCGPYSPKAVLRQGDQILASPLPGEVGDEMLEVWAAYADDESLHPLVRARLADLLWVRKHSDRGRWAQLAIETYVESAVPEVWICERFDGLARAVDICREANRQDLMVEPLDALAALAQEALDAPTDLYGPAASALIVLAHNGRPCAEMLDVAMGRYDSDPWRASELRALAIKTAKDSDTKRRLHEERIQAFEDEAGRSTGLRRIRLLQLAQDAARESGIKGEVGRLAGLIQSTDPRGDMEQIEVSTTIDQAEVQSGIDDIVGDDTLAQALTRFAELMAPDLDPERIDEQLARLAEAAPLQHIIGKIQIGPDNSVVHLPSGSELRREADRGGIARDKILWAFSIIGVPTLQAIHARYRVDRESLSTCLIGAGIPQSSADVAAASFERWAEGDYRSAVSALVLDVERMVRAICRAHGITIITSAADDAPGTRSLGPLIEDLAPHIETRYAQYLRSALVDKWSLNLRNRHAHGHGQPDQLDYAILFHIVCVLRELARQFPPNTTGSEQGS